MKRWAITSTLNPPEHVVSGRYAGSVLFCWYSRFMRQWYWVTGSALEVIAPPHMILVDEEWARANRNLSRTGVAPKISLAIRKKKAEQLLLF